MRVAMLVATVFAVALAIVTFAVIEVGANAYINKNYISEENKTARENEYAKELQEYVDRNGLSSTDIPKLAEWAQGNRYLYVMIHKDDKLLFETGQYEEPEKKPDDEEQNPDGGADGGTEGGIDGGTDGGADSEGDTTPPTDEPPTENGEESTDGTTGEDKNEADKEDSGSIGSGITVNMPTREELMKYAAEKEAHLITMSDASVLVSMADFTEYLYYDIVNIAAVMMAVIVLVVAVLLYSHGITRRISGIAKDVAAVAGGDMEHRIRPDGQDELGRLSGDVENMRSEMLKNVAKERAALDANAELVTSMSHDIRTPLTVLLGYLDVMRLHAPDGVMLDYINASEKTALRLKKLSDDMFNYFLLFGGGAGEVDMQEYDAYTLLDQMLSEHVLLLREQGYEVEINIISPASRQPSARIVTDANLLQRIIENVISNVLKYASRSHPVLLSAHIEDGKMLLNLITRISSTTDGVESNGIGLKTCRKLAEVIGASFETWVTDTEYSVTLRIDILEDEV